MATIPPTPVTKYRPPPSPGGLVDRPRLLKRLEPGRGRRLSLIHAPAGFGKTTLAVQWSDRLTTEGQSVAWLSIDPDDNNPVWLLAHLIEAVESARPGWSEQLRGLLEKHIDDAARYVLPVLIDSVDRSGEPLVVVVDDWHRVNDPRAIATMEFLLDQPLRCCTWWWPAAPAPDFRWDGCECATNWSRSTSPCCDSTRPSPRPS